MLPSSSSFLLKAWPNITPLSDNIIETILAVAAAFISPDSGRMVGIAKKAMFAAKSTAAYTHSQFSDKSGIDIEETLRTFTTSSCQLPVVFETNIWKGAWNTTLSI